MASPLNVLLSSHLKGGTSDSVAFFAATLAYFWEAYLSTARISRRDSDKTFGWSLLWSYSLLSCLLGSQLQLSSTYTDLLSESFWESPFTRKFKDIS